MMLLPGTRIGNSQDAAHLPFEFRPLVDEVAESFGHHEDPLAIGDLGEKIINGMRDGQSQVQVSLSAITALSEIGGSHSTRRGRAENP